MATEEEVKLAEKLNELERDREHSVQKQIEFANALNDLSEQQIAKLLKQQNISTELRKALQQARDTAQNTVDLYERQVKSLDEAKTRLDTIIASEKDRYKNSVLMEERNNVARAHRKATIQQLKALALSEKGITKEQEAQLENLVKLDKRLTKFGDGASDIAQTLFSGKAGGEAITSALQNIGGSIKSELSNNIKNAFEGADSLSGGLKAARSSIGKLGLVTLAMQMAKLAVEVGDAQNEFRRATGASEEFASSLASAYEETRTFNVTAKETGKAMTALFKTFTDFSTIQDFEVRNSLIKTTALLDRFGVSNEQTAKSIQTLTKGMGMNAEEAGKEMLNMVGFAQELGVAPEVLAEQFGEASDSLMKLGANGDEAFRDLAAAAKVTGLEVGKILNLVNQFDTFEGAARQAGKLNAALGGNFVNAMDLMMETDPTARFEMIRDAILDTGLTFDDMSYYQRNFYKDAMGLDSVGDLALVLSGNMESVSDETKKTTKDYEEAAREAKKLASFQDQLNAIMMQMIPIVEPLIDAFRELLGVFQENKYMLKILGGALMVAFGGIPGIVVAIVSLFDSIKIGSKKVSLLSVLFEGLGIGIDYLKEAFGEMKKSFVDAFGGGEQFSKTMENLIPIIKMISKFSMRLVTGPLTLLFKWFGFIAPAIAWFTNGIIELMGAMAAKNSPSFFDMFTGGMLASSLEVITKAFGVITGGMEIFGGVLDSVIAKITSMVAKLGEMKDAAANSFVGKMAMKGMDFVGGFSGGDEGFSEERFTQPMKPQSPADVAKMQKTMATANATSVGRSAAPTAANTNIAQNSSSNTYINSGPENAVIDVRIGDEKLGRVVTRIQDKRAAKAIAGRT